MALPLYNVSDKVVDKSQVESEQEHFSLLAFNNVKPIFELNQYFQVKQFLLHCTCISNRLKINISVIFVWFLQDYVIIGHAADQTEVNIVQEKQGEYTEYYHCVS